MQGLQDNSFAYESFVRVNTRRKRKGGKAQKGVSSPLDLLIRVKAEIATDGSWPLDCEGTYLITLHGSHRAFSRSWTNFHSVAELFQTALRDMRIKPQNILCLGLGSPCSSRDARAQLAFLNQLCTFSNIVRGPRILNRSWSVSGNACYRAMQMSPRMILSLRRQIGGYSKFSECSAPVTSKQVTRRTPLS
jgi:hypothetical protein